MRRVALAAAASVLTLVGSVGPVRATDAEFLPVGDPLERELRVLDVLGGAGEKRLRLATRPLQRFELDSLPMPDAASDPLRRIALARLWRVLGRDVDPRPAVPGLTGRLLQKRWPGGEALEISAGAEGRAEIAHARARYGSDTGVHLRAALASDRWLLYSHLVAGYQDSARSFADPIFLDTDVTTSTPESYVAYTGESRRWSVQFGRSRWHWGPGDEGSLVLSGTSAPITGLALHVRIEPLRADLTTLSATLRSAAGEQLAAHRIEWQAMDGLRVGVSEAVRYQSSAWRPLYLVGVVPYQLVQRLEVQDEPGAGPALRNNVMVATDVGWRIAPGTRVYAELLADDVHVIRRVTNPDKYAWQIGWEGVGPVRGTRVTWGGEYTRITRYVYTSFFGRDFVAQGRPLGFPFAPDARRIRLRAGWDLSADWQLNALAAETRQGENTLAEPYVSGHVNAATFEGVVATTREIEAGARWWPAGGVDLEASVGARRFENRDHVAGRASHEIYGRVAVRLVR